MTTINRTATSFGNVNYNQVLDQLGIDLDRKPGETYQEHVKRQTADLQVSDEQVRKFEEALKNFGNDSKNNVHLMGKGGSSKRFK